MEVVEVEVVVRESHAFFNDCCFVVLVLVVLVLVVLVQTRLDKIQ